MREIKFRAWDKEGKRIVYTENLSPHQDPDRFEVMQYIGLKDKNGREIYEGDVVENEDGERLVIEIDSIARGCLPFIEIAGPGWQSADESECEVIGNIYENSKLIDPTKNRDVDFEISKET